MLASLSAFFPCYNEEKNIRELIKQACAFLPTVAKTFEIIIVNDGSTDGTEAIVKSMQQDCPELKLVSHEKNRGYGAALRTGIESSQYEWIFWMDGDLQFTIRTIAEFVPMTVSYDAVIGFRKHRADTFMRRVNGELYTRLINFLFRTRIRDIDCGFKLIRGTILRQIHVQSSSAFTSAEILIKLRQAGARFYQIPVPHYPRKKGSPTGGNLRVILKGLRETILFFVHQYV